MQVDGFAEFDKVGTLVQPQACREGHPLANVVGRWAGTFYEWHCPACAGAGVADPVFRLRRRVGSLT